MDRKGCTSYIVGGFIKGVIIGGVVGGVAGLLLNASPSDVVRLSIRSGTAFGTIQSTPFSNLKPPVVRRSGLDLIFSPSNPIKNDHEEYDGFTLLELFPLAVFLEGPETWGNTYPTCLGPYQSPVNIETNDLEYREIRRPLKWSNLDKMPAYLNLEKTEISLGMTAVWKTKWDIPFISGGPLTERYYFYHLHFHWNTSSDAGSEHSVNQKRFPLEIHVVYTTRQDGAPPTEDDKILVTGYMVTLSGVDNPGFYNIIDSARKLTGEKEKQTSIPPFPFRVLGLDFCEDYVIYSGSLTTPPCSSGITWIISSRPVHLSLRQYNILKQAVSIPGRKYSANARPVQRLNGRKIFYVVTPGCPKHGFIKSDIY